MGDGGGHKGNAVDGNAAKTKSAKSAGLAKQRATNIKSKGAAAKAPQGGVGPRWGGMVIE